MQFVSTLRAASAHICPFNLKLSPDDISCESIGQSSNWPTNVIRRTDKLGLSRWLRGDCVAREEELENAQSYHQLLTTQPERTSPILVKGLGLAGESRASGCEGDQATKRDWPLPKIARLHFSGLASFNQNGIV